MRNENELDDFDVWNDEEMVYQAESNISSALTLEEVPFDRDLRWLNKSAGSRPRPKLNLNSSRLTRQVKDIAAENFVSLKVLDDKSK